MNDSMMCLDPSETNVINCAVKRQAVLGKSVAQIEADVGTKSIMIHSKTKEDREFLITALRNNFLFDNLEPGDLELFVGAMEKVVKPKDSTIITKGDIGDYFYILDTGKVSFVIDGKDMGSATRGKSFGELALLYNCPRTATAVATEDTTLWQVNQLTFRQIMMQGSKQEMGSVMDILRKVPFLSELSVFELVKISDALMEKSFKEGDYIVKKGDVGDFFYIIRSGRAQVKNIGTGTSSFVDHETKPGDFFGERALLTGEPRSADVVALTDITTLCMSRADFQSKLGNLQTLISVAAKKIDIVNVPIIASSKLHSSEVKELAELLMERTFKKGSFLNIEGQTIRNQGIYFVRSGKVRLINDKGTITNLTKGDHFGGQAIKMGGLEKSFRTVEFMEDTTCDVLTKRSIESVIGSVSRLGTPQSFTKRMAGIEFKDMDILQEVGRGSYGRVRLVRTKKDKKLYAMKIFQKEDVSSTKQIKGIIREKNIVASLDHPFITKLHSCFQDPTQLYMVLNFYPGGELYKLITSSSKGGVSPDAAKLYSACIVSSMAHVHSRYITFRDLKPENVMIDCKGFAVLIDFGFAKVVVDKTYTVCGTPEYMAPEVLMSKGYNICADFWSMGCLFYELLEGTTPFIRSGMTEMDLYRRIVKGKFRFPDHNNAFTTDAQTLISGLLTVRPSHRLGCLANLDNDVKMHPYYKGLDWRELRQRTLPTPFVPPPVPQGKVVPASDIMHSEKRRRSSQPNPAFDEFGEYVKIDETEAAKQSGGLLSGMKKLLFKRNK